jgi:putative SOS response-associated peptidase YedK
MCNLYSMTTNVEAIRRLFQVNASNDKTGNLPSMPGIYPDYPAPIVRSGSGGRELAMARWGMPSSQRALMDATRKRAQKLEAKGKTVDFKELLRLEPDSGTTNIRNVGSSHWKRWLEPDHRCLVPFNSFSETTRSTARRRQCGSQPMRAGLFSHSPAFGRTGQASGKREKAK